MRLLTFLSRGLRLVDFLFQLLLCLGVFIAFLVIKY
jgi:hypothetical protein